MVINSIPNSFDTMPREQVEIHLRYEGPDVADGTMSLQDIIPALQGFSGAYSKLAATDDPDFTHRVRISALRQGSADIVLEVWKSLGDNADQIMALSMLTSGVFLICEKLARVIQLKRHVQGRPYEESISANNSIVITNSENVTVEAPPSIHELFKSGKLNKDLDRITSPLVEGRIDAAEIEARSEDGNVLRERITVEERPYFESVEVTSTRETRLVGRLNSLTKTTNSGFMYLKGGKRVSYRYLGENHQQLYFIFGAHSGPVQVRCKARMNENLDVLSLDIFEIERMQGGLFEAPNGATKEGGDEDRVEVI